MVKDGPVLIMTMIFMLMIGGIMIFGMVENAKYSGFKQTALDKSNSTYAVEKKS